MDTWYFGHVLLAAAYANKGETTKAASARVELEKRLLDYAIGVLKSKGYSRESTYARQAETHLYPGLRKAGVPES